MLTAAGVPLGFAIARRPGQPRKNARLPGFDYSQPGAYFFTIVCSGRDLVLQDERFKAAVEEAWRWLGKAFRQVELDAFVVMPNHVHGVLILKQPPQGRWQAAPTKPLGRLIGAFKTKATRRINEIRGTPTAPVWQRNYYERVVRDEDELNRIRQYIIENPSKWHDDPENPDLRHSR